jgi:hypothetical protein
VQRCRGASAGERCRLKVQVRGAGAGAFTGAAVQRCRGSAEELQRSLRVAEVHRCRGVDVKRSCRGT